LKRLLDFIRQQDEEEANLNNHVHVATKINISDN